MKTRLPHHLSARVEGREGELGMPRARNHAIFEALERLTWCDDKGGGDSARTQPNHRLSDESPPQRTKIASKGVKQSLLAQIWLWVCAPMDEVSTITLGALD